ncbi:hypothetical protein CKO40_05385 [Halochromatium glycolicum]|uniref:Uncharacterized protein n=1 Tax=Halochromatium glycolicum TaxID=85075 RepID=A0AAJ0U365_9GAMM|nr:hypothetical protein [Halochromatium glycolicum]
MTALLPIAFLVSCGNPGEDVRITLCKDLVRGQLGSGATPTWSKVTTQTPGYQDAVIQLGWTAPSGNGAARCYYPYNAVDDTAQQLADPLTAYATSPSKVIINGQTLSGSALARAVAEAMRHQGQQLLDSAGQLIQQ